MNTRKKYIEVENNEEVSAVHHKADTNKWIFLCHGFGGNKDRGNKYRAEFLNENGWNAVRLDFRGNGDSSGNFKEQNLSSRIEDLTTVVEHFNPEHFVLFGTSFGGKVVFHAQKRFENIKGIIGKAPVTYKSIMDPFRSVVKEKGEFEYIEGKPIDKKFFEDFDKYDFGKTAQNIDVPVLIFHGSSDTTVHPENSLDAAKTIREIAIWKFEDEKHSFSDEAKENMNNELVHWLENKITH